MAESVSAQLETLYRAGKKTFPDRAEALAEALQTIGEVHAAWYAPTIRAGEPDALRKAREINEEVYHLLHRAVLTWQDVALALVAIANDFRDTDAAAAEAAGGLGFRLDTYVTPGEKLASPPSLKEVSP